MAVGERRMVSFAQSLGFEILDCEKTDTITLSFALEDRLGRTPENSSGGSDHRRITYATTLSMAEFRHRPEEKIETVVPVEFDVDQWHDSGSIASGCTSNNKLITGKLGLSLVYTDDIDEPSIAGFLACGLCLCPPMTLSTAGSTTS